MQKPNWCRNVWKENLDDVNYDVTKMSHEEITARRCYDVFTTFTWPFKFSFFYSYCLYIYSFRCVAFLLYQRRISTKTTLIVNFWKRCFNVDIWLKMKVEWTYVYWRCFKMTKQRWTNVGIELRFFKVDNPLPIRCWYLVEN